MGNGSISFVVGDRVRSKDCGGRGTVMGFRFHLNNQCPDRVVVRWDEYTERFTENCNAHPEAEHVLPRCLVLVK